jgi:hypothetical protein
VIRGWERQYRSGFNIGFNLKASRIVAVAPDSPEWLAKFEQRGLPETATYQSGGGEGHVHFLYRLPEGGPVARICRSSEFDIMSAGYAVAPPSRHASGQFYTWHTDTQPKLEDLPEAPDWVINMLEDQVRQQSHYHVETPSPGYSGDEAPVRLNKYAQQLWENAGSVAVADRSGRLWELGCLLKEANASESAIVAALQNRDQHFGWNKYTDRPEEYANTARKIMTREQKAPESTITLDDGPLPVAKPSSCADQVAALQGRNNQLEALLAETQTNLCAILSLDRNPHIKAQRTTIKAIAVELLSAINGGRTDPDGWVKIWRNAIAENAGNSPDTVGTHIEAMARDNLIEKNTQYEHIEQTDSETGEVIPVIRPRLYIRAIGTVSDLFTRAATWQPSPSPKRPGKGSWGGKRQPVCPKHPSAGTLIQYQVLCAEPGCGQVLTAGETKPVERERQDAAHKDQATVRPRATTYHRQDDGHDSEPPGTDQMAPAMRARTVDGVLLPSSGVPGHGANCPGDCWECATPQPFGWSGRSAGSGNSVMTIVGSATALSR